MMMPVSSGFRMKRPPMIMECNLIGYLENYKGSGKDWFLIKDSSSGSRNVVQDNPISDIISSRRLHQTENDGLYGSQRCRKRFAKKFK